MLPLPQDTIFPNGEIHYATRPASHQSPALTTPLLSSVLLGVAIFAVGLLTRRWWRGWWRRARGTTFYGGVPLMSGTQIAAMSERERRFMSDALAGAAATGRPDVVRGAAAARAAAGGYAGPVHCPACAAQLGVGGPRLQYVTRCPACARWLSARSEDGRVVVEVRVA
jgi:hypothetical protein